MYICYDKCARHANITDVSIIYMLYAYIRDNAYIKYIINYVTIIMKCIIYMYSAVSILLCALQCLIPMGILFGVDGLSQLMENVGIYASTSKFHWIRLVTSYSITILT